MTIYRIYSDYLKHSESREIIYLNRKPTRKQIFELFKNYFNPKDWDATEKQAKKYFINEYIVEKIEVKEI